MAAGGRRAIANKSRYGGEGQFGARRDYVTSRIASRRVAGAAVAAAITTSLRGRAHARTDRVSPHRSTPAPPARPRSPPQPPQPPQPAWRCSDNVVITVYTGDVWSRWYPLQQAPPDQHRPQH